MPVEFLSDEQAAAYGRFGRILPLQVLEPLAWFDNADRELIAVGRGERNRLGFAAQLLHRKPDRLGLAGLTATSPYKPRRVGHVTLFALNWLVGQFRPMPNSRSNSRSNSVTPAPVAP